MQQFFFVVDLDRAVSAARVNGVLGALAGHVDQVGAVFKKNKQGFVDKV